MASRSTCEWESIHRNENVALSMYSELLPTFQLWNRHGPLFIKSKHYIYSANGEPEMNEV